MAISACSSPAINVGSVQKRKQKKLLAKRKSPTRSIEAANKKKQKKWNSIRTGTRRVQQKARCTTYLEIDDDTVAPIAIHVGVGFPFLSRCQPPPSPASLLFFVVLGVSLAVRLLHSAFPRSYNRRSFDWNPQEPHTINGGAQLARTTVSSPPSPPSVRRISSSSNFHGCVSLENDDIERTGIGRSRERERERERRKEKMSVCPRRLLTTRFFPTVRFLWLPSTVIYISRFEFVRFGSGKAMMWHFFFLLL